MILVIHASIGLALDALLGFGRNGDGALLLDAGYTDAFPSIAARAFAAA